MPKGTYKTHQILPTVVECAPFRDIVTFTLILALITAFFLKSDPGYQSQYYIRPYFDHTESTIPLKLQLITF